MTNDAPGPFPNGGGDPPNFKGTVGQIMKFIVGTTVTGESDTSFDPSASGATLRGGSQQSPSMVRLADGNGGITSGVSIDKYRMLTLNELPVHTILNNTLWAGMRDGASYTLTLDSIPIDESPELQPWWIHQSLQLVVPRRRIHRRLWSTTRL
jgi:hypothetical protein